MSRRRPPTLKLLTCAILALLPALSAQAQQQDRDRGQQRDDDRSDRGQQQDSRSSLSDAVRRVERDTRGEVLSAERVQYDGRDMHRVKVMDDQGRVRVFMQDPQRRSDNRDSGNRDSGSSNRPPRNDSGGNRSSDRRPPPSTRDDD